MTLDKTTLMAGILLYLFILVLCFVGAMVRDSYNTMTNKVEKVELARVLVSTITASILVFSFSDYILSSGNYKILVFGSFMGGILGFELLGQITKLSFWVKIFKDKIKIDVSDTTKK